MSKKKNVDLIFKKLGVTEEEMSILMEYFVEKHIKENLNISQSLNMDISQEGYSKYLKIKTDFDIENKDGEKILSSSVQESVSID